MPRHRNRRGPAAIALLLAALPATLAEAAAGPSFDEALALQNAGRLRDALRAWHSLAESGEPAVEAAARNNACALQMDLGDYRGALPDCRAALRASRSAGDPDTLGRALNNLGLVLEMVGNTTDAESSYREALQLNRRRGDAEGQAVNLGNLGALALSAGRYSLAMALYREAESLAEHHRAAGWSADQIEIARINQGVVLEKLGAFHEALNLYRGVLATASDPRRKAALLVNTGVLYRNLGDPVRAATAFREAIGRQRTLGDRAALSNAWLNLGLAQHLNLAQPRAAEVSYRTALRLAEESGDRTEEIQDLFYLGRLLTDGGRLDEAGAVYGRCLAAAERSGSAEGTWSAREGLGRIAAARGDLPGALAHFQAAAARIEGVRSGLARPRRQGWFGDRRSVYSAMIAVLGELERRQPGRGWGDRALETVQHAKARDLLDALGTGRRAAPPLGAAILRARAGDGAVLEYFVGESHLFLWIVRRESSRMADLGPHRPILDAVARVHRALAHGEPPSAADLAGLSRSLLGPAQPLPPPGALLRVAPDGRLRHLPFELLSDPGDPAVTLVDRAAVAYLPSASTLSPKAGERKVAWRLAGFGDPVLPAGGDARTPAGLLVERFGLARLPAAGRELASVGRLLGGKRALFTGERATESAFRQAAQRGARVLHLATHTIVDERPGRGAAILLSAEGDDDGLLTPDEIARLSCRSSLTILAACRTALGGEDDGAALSSLTGSFLAAGSQGVIATLWDVDDAATAVFMDQLYDRLGRGEPPAEALRNAKRRLRSDPRWQAPNLWAGYVLVGDPPPVAPASPFWPWAAGAAVLLILTALAWRRWKPTGSSVSRSGA